jgi:hypothetical protein
MSAIAVFVLLVYGTINELFVDIHTYVYLQTANISNDGLIYQHNVIRQWRFLYI